MKEIKRNAIMQELENEKIVIINPKPWLDCQYPCYLGGKIVKNGFYYHYSYFGSSAIKANYDDLAWLLETIFKLKETDKIYSTDTLFI